jgi:hypothetical protein
VSDSASGWHAEGRISYTSFITDMLRTDQSILDENSFPFSDFVEKMFWTMAQLGARSGMDNIWATQLPKDLSKETRARLFHERVHYAQLLSYPLLQLRFLHQLEELRIRVAQRGGLAAMICGETASDMTGDLSEVLREKGIIDTIVMGDSHVESDDVATAGEGASDVGVMTVRMTSPEGEQMPGWSGVLRFGESYQLVPFTGLNMLESAAYITQLLFEGAPLPRLTEKGTVKDQRYLGCWEVWCRMHAHRYKSETDLALGFLAAIDLALSAHVLAQEDGALKSILEQDPKYSVEIRYIGSRLARIMIYSAAIDPLDSSDGSFHAIQKFQSDCSNLFGWPDPRRAYRFMAAFLTRRLIMSSLWTFERSVEIDKDAIRTAILMPLDEIADNLEVLVPTWRMLEASFQATLNTGSPNQVHGARVLAKMITSSVFRADNQSVLAAAHMKPQTLAENFNLPVIRIGDRYYMDWDLSDSTDMRPELLEGSIIQLPAIDVMVDSIQLAALEALRSSQSKCGLIDPVTRTANCAYVAGGAGCPQLGLSKVQQEQRNANEIYDWCHWAYVSLHIGLAPESLQREWTQRWRAAALHVGNLSDPSPDPAEG